MELKRDIFRTLVLVAIGLCSGIYAWAQYSLSEAQDQFALSRFALAKPLFEKAYDKKIPLKRQEALPNAAGI